MRCAISETWERINEAIAKADDPSENMKQSLMHFGAVALSFGADSYYGTNCVGAEVEKLEESADLLHSVAKKL
jgi:hypothetical protein